LYCNKKRKIFCIRLIWKKLKNTKKKKGIIKLWKKYFFKQILFV
jgi:hypothetical protein